MKRRILIFHLILVFVFSTLSFTPGMLTNVSAAGVEIPVGDADALTDALNAAGDGDIIKLMAAIEYSQGITINGKSIIFDLNGFDLNVNNGVVTETGLAVTNGGIDLTGSGEFNVTGSTGGVYADNATVTVTNATSSGGTAAYADNGGEITVDGNADGYAMGAYAVGAGSTVAVSGDATATGIGSRGAEASNGGSITIGGNVQGGYAGAYAHDEGSNITVGGDVTASGISGADVYENSCYGAYADDGEIIIEGSASATGNGMANIAARSENGGSITVDGDAQGGNVGVYSNGSGSTITVKTNVVATKADEGIGALAQTGGEITIDGTITAAIYIEVNEIKDGSPESRTIPTTKPGYFTYTDGANTVWVIDTTTYTTEIDGTQYATLDEALAAVQAGEATATTIKLLQDIDYDGGITVNNKKIIFDLDGKTLSVNNTGGTGLTVLNDSVIDITNPGAFNVMGSEAGLSASNSTVMVTNAEGDASYGVVAGNNSVVTVTNDVASTSYMAVAASDGSEINIEGNASGAIYGVYAQDANTIITVAGDVSAAGDNSCGAHSRGGAAVEVLGNVTATGNNSKGANLNTGGTLTIDGIITAQTYIILGAVEKTAADITTPTTKAGYLTYTDDDSTVWVKADDSYVAEIDGTQYTTLDDALAAVTDGQAIRLLKDVTHASKIEADSKSFIIDVSGFKLTVNVSGENCVSAVNGQSITIDDTADGGSFEVNGSGMKDGFGIKGLYADGDASTISVTVPATINVTGQGNIGVYAGSRGVIDAELTDINNTAGNGYVYGVIVYEGGTAHVGNIAVSPSGNWCIGVYVYGDALSDGQTSATVEGTISADEYIRMGPVTVDEANVTLPTTKAGYRTYKLDDSADANTVWVRMPSMTDAEKVAADKEALTFEAIKNENMDSDNITDNLTTLPTAGTSGSTISWSSSDPSTVSDTGLVNRPENGEGDKEVTLTATITCGAESDTVVFSLTVKEMTQTEDVTLPTWPVGSALTASNVGQTSLTLTWTAATDDIGVTGYKLFKDGIPYATVGNILTSGVTGLTAGTQYTFRVEACDAAGNWSSSGPSAIITTAAAPVIPALPTISPDGGTFAGSTTVTVTGSGGTVYYTTDGSNPTTSSTQYTAPFTLKQSATVKAAVYSNSNVWSGVASAIFTITASPGDSGDSGRGGSSNTARIVEPKAAAQLLDSNGNVGKTVTIKLDKSTGTAAVEIDAVSLNGVFDKSKADGEGVKTVKINIPAIDGTKAYEPILPASFFTSADAMKAVEIKTGIAAVTVPGNMLQAANAAVTQNVSLTIAAVDKSKLPAEVQAQIGSRPVIELSLKIGGKPTSWSNESAPVTVSIPYTPTAEELKDPEHITVWYIDGSGKTTSVPSGRYDPATGMVTFTTTHFSKYAAVFAQKTFNDLGGAIWAKKPIEVLASKGILRGISEKEYAPSTNITRADFLYYLVRALGVDARVDGNFEDISSDAYYYKEIGIAKKLGITSGMGNNKFNPDASITRQDMMVLTERALRMLKQLKQQGTAMDLERFSDKSLIAAYATGSVASIVKEGLMVGSGDNITPLSNTTRAEAAVFLYRIYNKY